MTVIQEGAVGQCQTHSPYNPQKQYKALVCGDLAVCQARVVGGDCQIHVGRDFVLSLPHSFIVINLRIPISISSRSNTLPGTN